MMVSIRNFIERVIARILGRRKRWYLGDKSLGRYTSHPTEMQLDALRECTRLSVAHITAQPGSKLKPVLPEGLTIEKLRAVKKLLDDRGDSCPT